MVTVSNQIVEVLSLIGGVHNCYMLEDNFDISEHYDCKADIDKAIELLQEIKEEIQQCVI